MVAAALLVEGARHAHAYPIDDLGWRPLFALNVDAGFSWDFREDRLLTTGGVGAGASMFDGEQLLSLTADIAGMLGHRMYAGLTLERINIRGGLGTSGSALYDLTNRAPGVAASISYNIVHLQGAAFFDDGVVPVLSVILRLPLGYIGYLAFTER